MVLISTDQVEGTKLVLIRIKKKNKDKTPVYQ